MFDKKISEVIKRLEEIKDIYGDLRVMIHTTGGSSDFVEEIFMTTHCSSKGIEHVVFISD